MAYQIVKANLSHMQDLLKLYFTVYGADYPIRIGYDVNDMERALTNPDKFYWLVAVNEEGKVIGSTVFQLDLQYAIGKVIAVAVSPDYRGQHISTRLIAEGTKTIFSKSDGVHALYTTARTLSVASQLMFLSNGYYPLGIFPNAHKIQQFETLTFMGAFRENVLTNRAYVQMASDKLKPILKISNKIFGKKSYPHAKKLSLKSEQTSLKKFSQDEKFEFIFAPNFVNKLYQEERKQMQTPSKSQIGDDFIGPFELPNLLIVASNIDLKLFAYFSPKDHYCIFISCNKKLEDYGPHLKQLIFQMKDHGISYIETLIRLDCDGTIEYLLKNRFLPSAICPAFLEKDGKYYDYIFLSRTMEPLDFSNMQIDSAFKPYIDQYIELWTDLHVSSLQILSHKE